MILHSGAILGCICTDDSQSKVKMFHFLVIPHCGAIPLAVELACDCEGIVAGDNPITRPETERVLFGFLLYSIAHLQAKSNASNHLLKSHASNHLLSEAS